MGGLGVAWHLQKAVIRGEMQYRLNFVLLAVLGLVYQGSGFAFVWVVLQNTDRLAGWTFPELALLYAMRLLAHACWGVPFHQIQFLDTIVREGRFDRYLVRPLNPLLQVMTTRFQMHVVGDVVAAVLLLVVAVNLVDIDFSVLHVLYLVLAVLGGALAEGAAVLLVSSLAFRFVQTWAANNLVDNVYLMFGSYPTRIFGGAVGWALTWVLPVAFVAYVPSGVLLDKTGALSVPAVVAWAAPLVGAVWFTAAYRVWRWQIHNYQSVGN